MVARASTSTPVTWTSAATTQSISVTRAAGQGIQLDGFFEREFGGAPNAITSVVWDPTGDNQALSVVQNVQSGSETRRLFSAVLAAPTSAKTADIVVTFAGSNNNRGIMIASLVEEHDGVRDSSSADDAEVPLSVDTEEGDLVLAASFHRDDDVAIDPGPDMDGFITTEISGAFRVLAIGYQAAEPSPATSTEVVFDNNGLGGGPFDSCITAVSWKPGAGGPTEFVIREQLVDENGDPIASATGITVLVWRAAAPSGAPNVTLTSQTTDASGNTEWRGAIGALEEDDPVFYIAYMGSPPTAWTCGKVVPDLE